MNGCVTRGVAVALGLFALSMTAAAQGQMVDPPTTRDILRWLDAPPDAMIYNVRCDRRDHRTFDCGFDMPPGAAIRHIEIRAVWVGTDWSYSFRQ
jgi:hypothetical protein